jgi:multidrug efflux pump subunit AcrA (membrane-fusion protein)
MGPIDWGDAPTWIAGSFAALAAYYARGTLRSQQSQIAEQRAFIAEQAANLRLEREQLQAQLADRRSEQARHIRMRCQVDGAELNDETGQLENADQWVVVVQNTSDSPIYEVEATFGDHAARWVNTADRAGGGTVQVLGRDQRATFVSPRLPPTRLMSSKPSVRFRDADGIWWRLLHDERLEEVPAPGDA